MGRASRRKQETRRLFRNRPQPDHGQLFRKAMADVELERRQARERMDKAIGPIPDSVERFRRAVDAIDPAQSYTLVMPGGQVVTQSGAVLLAAARPFLSLIEAHEAGDEAALRRAALAFLAAI